MSVSVAHDGVARPEERVPWLDAAAVSGCDDAVVKIIDIGSARHVDDVDTVDPASGPAYAGSQSRAKTGSWTTRFILFANAITAALGCVGAHGKPRTAQNSFTRSRSVTIRFTCAKPCINQFLRSHSGAGSVHHRHPPVASTASYLGDQNNIRCVDAAPLAIVVRSGRPARD